MCINYKYIYVCNNAIRINLFSWPVNTLLTSYNLSDKLTVNKVDMDDNIKVMGYWMGDEVSGKLMATDYPGVWLIRQNHHSKITASHNWSSYSSGQNCVAMINKILFYTYLILWPTFNNIVNHVFIFMFLFLQKNWMKL